MRMSPQTNQQEARWNWNDPISYVGGMGDRGIVGKITKRTRENAWYMSNTRLGEAASVINVSFASQLNYSNAPAQQHP